MKNNASTPIYSIGKVTNFPDGSFRVDFGQPIKGIVLLSPEGKEIDHVWFDKQKAPRKIKGDVKLLQTGVQYANNNGHN